MANLKTKMKYRVVTGINPRTKESILRPIVAERETYYIDQFVAYALNFGFVRGKFHDMRGALNGFIEAMQQLGKDGKSVNLADWLRMRGELTGTVDETRQLTDRNDYRVIITALKELKRKATEFSWTNVDDNSANPRIDKIVYLNGRNDNEIKVGVPIVATGANIFYNVGDTVVASWYDDEGTAHSCELVPDEFSDAHERFQWPSELSAAPAGTDVTFTFTFRGGVEGGQAKVAHHIAKIIAGEVPPVEPLIVIPEIGAKVMSVQPGASGEVRFGEKFRLVGEGLRRLAEGRGGIMSIDMTTDELTVEGDLEYDPNGRWIDVTLRNLEEIAPGDHTGNLNVNAEDAEGTSVGRAFTLTVVK